MARLTMIEFPTRDATASAAFFRDVFGWPHVDYGAEYADVQLGGEQTLGFQGDVTEGPSAPLPIIEVADLAAARASIERGGGVVTAEPFDFPGGTRLHFREPGGNELAVWAPHA